MTKRITPEHCPKHKAKAKSTKQPQTKAQQLVGKDKAKVAKERSAMRQQRVARVVDAIVSSVRYDMLAIIFYANAVVATLVSIVLGIAGLPLPAFTFGAYAIMCIIIGTASVED